VSPVRFVALLLLLLVVDVVFLVLRGIVIVLFGSVLACWFVGWCSPKSSESPVRFVTLLLLLVPCR